MKTIFITGGAGFIGGNLVLHFHTKYPEYRLIVIDKLTYAANPDYLKGVQGDRFVLEQADIANAGAMADLFSRYQPDAVVHLAAESHVDNSIAGPEAFVETNVTGTFRLLEETRKLNRKRDLPIRFHHVSTDEVFGSLGSTGYFTEGSPYQPNSPYSASKAASDHLVRAYVRTYGFDAVVTNCSNNFGPNQHDEKLIPTIIRSALAARSIPIYGNGTNIRDWLFVQEHCEAIDLVLHRGRTGETYNIGGSNEWKNIDLAREICTILDQLEPRKTSYSEQITYVADRPGHDERYAIDSSKIQTELGWVHGSEKFNEQLRVTINWYVNRYARAARG